MSLSCTCYLSDWNLEHRPGGLHSPHMGLQLQLRSPALPGSCLAPAERSVCSRSQEPRPAAKLKFLLREEIFSPSYFVFSGLDPDTGEVVLLVHLLDDAPGLVGELGHQASVLAGQN